LAILNKSFSHKNDILKQKGVARSERVRMNLKYTKGNKALRGGRKGRQNTD